MVYAALGDSMSIDDYAGGPGLGAASLLWRNQDHHAPEWTGRDLTTCDRTSRLVLLASDGATSADVAGDQVERLRGLDVVASLATVTMGGNDLLAAYGDSTAARRAVATTARNGRRVLAGLRDLMGREAPIVVATVYDPSDGTGDVEALGLPAWPDALDLLAELNDALRTLAFDHGALLADVHGRFLGHGLAAGDPAQPAHRPANRNLWYCGLIEPNAWGASEIRGAFWDSLASMEAADLPPRLAALSKRP